MKREKAAPEITLVVIEGVNAGQQFVMKGAQAYLGRENGMLVHVDDSATSRRHAKLAANRGQLEITDLHSTNGTLVNGSRVDRATLKDGDRIQIGSTVLKVFFGGGGELKVYDMATRDPLLGVFNKTHLLTRLEAEFKRWQRYQAPLSVLMCDLDHFKNVNDTFGHPAGDLCLARVAAAIRKSVREVDLVGRYGGEEFLVLFPQTNGDGARALAERIRAAVAAEKIVHAGPDTRGRPGPHPIAVTVSIGVASTSAEAFSTAEALVAKADANLYQSKQNGRNRVTG